MAVLWRIKGDDKVCIVDVSNPKVQKVVTSKYKEDKTWIWLGTMLVMPSILLARFIRGRSTSSAVQRAINFTVNYPQTKALLGNNIFSNRTTQGTLDRNYINIKVPMEGDKGAGLMVLQAKKDDSKKRWIILHMSLLKGSQAIPLPLKSLDK